MAEAPSSLVFFMECGDGVEAAAIKALLEEHGVPATVQGENAVSLMPHLQPIMAPRILVPESALARAHEVLASNQPKGTSGDPIEGGICAVHEQPAVAICSRCGSFLCTACGSLGDPPVCESCLEAEKLPQRNRSPMRAEFIVTVVVLALGALTWVASLVFGGR